MDALEQGLLGTPGPRLTDPCSKFSLMSTPAGDHLILNKRAVGRCLSSCVPDAEGIECLSVSKRFKSLLFGMETLSLANEAGYY